MRQGGNQTEKESVPYGPAFADEVRRHQRLAVAGCQCMSRAEQECEQYRQPKAIVCVHDEPQQAEAIFVRLSFRMLVNGRKVGLRHRYRAGSEYDGNLSLPIIL